MDRRISFRFNLPTLGFVLGCLFALPMAPRALDLGAGLDLRSESEKLTFSLTRMVKPPALWSQWGGPGGFIYPIPGPPDTSAYLSLHGVEYTIGVSAWPWKRLQLRSSLPIESNRLDISGVSTTLNRPGDLECGASLLGLGNRLSSLRGALDAWVRLPTGAAPFGLNDPILATGRGTTHFGVGGWATQRLGRFSFFQWINYEKGRNIGFESFLGSPVPPSLLGWPDQMKSGGRVILDIYRRGERTVGLGYEFRYVRRGDWLRDGQVWATGTGLWYSTGVLRVRVDPRMTVEGRLTLMETGPGLMYFEPYGNFMTVTLFYHPVFRERR